MNAAKNLEYLIQKVEKDKRVFISQKITALELLKRLYKETLCHEDRRLPDHELRALWKAFVQHSAGTKFLDEPQEFLYSIEDFFGIVSAPKITLSQRAFDQYDVFDFFLDLERDLLKLKDCADHERSILYLGIKLMLLIAEQPKHKRDQKVILSAWRLMKLTLDERKMLQKFRESEALRVRIKKFLNEN